MRARVRACVRVRVRVYGKVCVDNSRLGTLPSLRKLFLNDNKLSTVPPSIGDLLQVTNKVTSRVKISMTTREKMITDFHP